MIPIYSDYYELSAAASIDLCQGRRPGRWSAVRAAPQEETRTIPMGFVSLADPIGSGFISSLAHPGGNMTGHTTFEPSIAGKWCSMLTEVTPGRKAAFDPDRTFQHFDRDWKLGTL